MLTLDYINSRLQPNPRNPLLGYHKYLLPYNMSGTSLLIKLTKKKITSKSNTKFNFKVNKNFNTSINDINITQQTNYLNLKNIKKHSSKTTNLIFLHNFLIENDFIHHFKQNFKKPNLILTKAPSYKMDEYSSITSNRDRGNIYMSLNFLQKSTFSLSQTRTLSNSAYFLNSQNL